MSDGTPPGYNEDDDGRSAYHADAADAQDMYHFLDPLDPRKVSLDIFEMYCHEMIITPMISRRAYLINKMKVSLFLMIFCSVYFLSLLIKFASLFFGIVSTTT